MGRGQRANVSLRDGVRLAVLLCTFLFAAAPVHARETTKFITTIKNVQLKSVEGNWIKIIEPDKPVDLVTAEAAIGLFNKGKIPPGRYVNFRIVLSETFTIAGRDGSNYTNEGGSAVMGGPMAKSIELPGEVKSFKEAVPTWNFNSVGDVRIQVNFDFEDADEIMTMTALRDFDKPLPIERGSFIRVFFSFDLSNAVAHGWTGIFGDFPKSDIMYLDFPKEIEELRITVDKETMSLPPNKVIIEF